MIVVYHDGVSALVTLADAVGEGLVEFLIKLYLVNILRHEGVAKEVYPI